MDPITLEVLRGQLDAAAEEMQVTLLKSSYSTIISESLDATSALFDCSGNTVAQAVSIPIHLAVLAELGRRFAEAFPADVANEGDLYIVNDPCSGGTHLPDADSLDFDFTGTAPQTRAAINNVMSSTKAIVY